MGKFFTEINEHHQAFIEKQHLFFVSTAPLNAEGHINLSPKGLNSFKVLGPNEVGYMDLISSGMKQQPTHWKMDGSLLCFVLSMPSQKF